MDAEYQPENLESQESVGLTARRKNIRVLSDPGVSVDFVDSGDPLTRAQGQANVQRRSSSTKVELSPGSAEARQFEVAVAPIPSIAGEYPENFAGFRYDWYAGRVDVYLVDPRGAGTVELERLIQKNGSQYFNLVLVPLSDLELSAATEKIAAESDTGQLAGMGVSMIDVDRTSGRIQLLIDGDKSKRVMESNAISSLETGTQVDLQKLAQSIGVGIDVAIETYEAPMGGTNS